MDTIGIRILKPMNEVKANMKASLIIKMKSGKMRTYSSENWCMWQRNNMTFIQFSLTKFVSGNNLKNVSYKKLINSLKYVIKIINLPPSQLFLYRVDLAYSFIMPYDTKYYLSELNELTRLSVSTYNNNNSRKYYSKFISVLLYDKLKEMFGNRIPTELNHLANRVLRFEVQFTKGLKQLLNYSRHLLLEDLYNPEVLKILLVSAIKSFPSKTVKKFT
ncbi:MAG: phage/plasmid replication domain-containing protein [Candidatus Doudnabacteria bacterium]